MTIEQVIELMKKGYALRNHGHGWHLYPPGKPVGQVLKVAQDLVDALGREGRISISIPYTSAVAVLVEPQEGGAE